MVLARRLVGDAVHEVIQLRRVRQLHLHHPPVIERRAVHLRVTGIRSASAAPASISSRDIAEGPIIPGVPLTSNHILAWKSR